MLSKEESRNLPLTTDFATNLQDNTTYLKDDNLTRSDRNGKYQNQEEADVSQEVYIIYAILTFTFLIVSVSTIIACIRQHRNLEP